MRQSRTAAVLAAGAVIAMAIGVDVLLGACARGPTAPTPLLVVITITAGGTSPQNASAPSLRVEFVNQDTQPHDIRSNPHPAHTDCPEVNVGVIQPGERKALPATSGPRTCRYHDETRPDDERFQGSITTQ